jgi:hypothetical protein
MNRSPSYKQGDTVWMRLGAGDDREGQVVRYRGGAQYEVAVAGQGVREVNESKMYPRQPRKDYGPGPAEPE